MASTASTSEATQASVPDKAWNKCVRLAESAQRNSPRVHTLLRKIEAAGCTLATSPIVCEDVFQGAQVVGAYDAERKQVVMNPGVPASYLHQSEWTRGVVHELVHAYDACRAQINPNNCDHIACTEIRAANLSGDCDFGTELSRRAAVMITSTGIGGAQQQCVRRRAELSLAMHEPCVSSSVGATASRSLVGKVDGGKSSSKPLSTSNNNSNNDKTARHVSKVWDACYADTAPFSTN